MGLDIILKKKNKQLSKEFFTNPILITPRQKILIRGLGLSLGGFLLLLIPYITFIGPFVLISGGFFLGKWHSTPKETEEELDTDNSDEFSNDNKEVTNSWRNTDSGI